ncbi:MAG: hypothetical protein R3A79_11230 [Nannocystaceae bacterium]
MHRLFPLLTACLLVACGGKPDSQSAPPEEMPAEEGRADPNAQVDDDAAPPENCDFTVKDKCYTDQAEACAAAGCEPDKCMVLESYPAQIQCG